MLTLSKPISAGQAQAYHKSEFANAKENYYTEGERVRGEWQGQLAARYGLRGEVNEEQFARLSEGQHPATGEALIRRQQAREYVNDKGETTRTMEHRAGWDATFSAPKSVSLTALVGGDNRVREAHRESVRVALDEMERYAQARIGGNAVAQTTGAWAVAKFEHDSSRPVDGYAAPQLHTHAVIFNVTETAEGKTRSLQAQELYKTQQYATAVYRSELAARLQRMGYEVERGAHGQPEIKGYTREYLDASSPRRQQIEARLEEQGRRGAGAAQIAAHRTRDAKQALSVDEVRMQHQRLAAEHGNQPQRVMSEAARRWGVELEPERSRHVAESAVTYARERGIERTAVIDERALLRDALKHTMGEARLPEIKDELQKRIASGELIEVPRRDGEAGRAFTTGQMQDFERQIVERMRAGRDGNVIVDGHTREWTFKRHPHLSVSQHRAVEDVLESRDKMMALEGVAGAGKTTSLAAVRDAVVHHGYEVKGLAPTSRAAQKLAEAGMETETLQRHLARGQQPDQQPDGGRARVYIVDEASMVSTRQMHSFVERLHRHDRVLFVGDVRQHEAVEAGRPYAQLQEAGLRTARLDEILRQKDPVLKETVEQLARGEVKEAIASLNNQGRVHEIKDRGERIGEMAREYARSPERTLVISPDNESRREINSHIHRSMRQAGQVTGTEYRVPVLYARQELTGADRQHAQNYTEGDVIRYTKGSKPIGIEAGEYARVARVDAESNRVTVTRKSGEELSYDPRRLQGVTVYRDTERVFAQGDRVQMTAPYHEQKLANRELGTVEKIDNSGNLKLRMDSGREVEFNVRQMPHLDTSTVAGTFVYTPAAGTVPGAGTRTLSVTLTPTDTTDYNAATTTVQLTVNKATPTISWATPGAITYGTALSATQLNATSTVAGTFVYTPAAGTVPGAGTQTLSVTLTPTDTTDYNTAATTVQLTVSQATPTISVSDIPSSASYGGSFTITYSYSGIGSPTESVSSSTTGVCTASGNTVNYVGLGICTLTASATATAGYTAATGSPQSFGVTVSQNVVPTPGDISTVVGNGIQGATGDGGAATSAELDWPEGVAVDGAGNIYIADLNNSRIRKVTFNNGIGTITTVAGGGSGCSQQTDLLGDGCPATSAELSAPAGVAVDGAGNIYIADNYNNRIRKVTFLNGIGTITTVAGGGSGCSQQTDLIGDGCPATSAELDWTTGVAVDSAGNIYIGDSLHNVIRMVAENSTINGQNGYTIGDIYTVAGGGSGCSQQTDLLGDGCPATSAELYWPNGVALDSAGNIYISDELNSRIRKVTFNNGIGTITTLAGGNGGDYDSGDGGTAASANLAPPSGVAVDSAGNIYIAGWGGQRIRKVNALTGDISTVAGNGTAGYNGDGEAATSAELYSPIGVAVDASENVYIADTFNSLIRAVWSGLTAASVSISCSPGTITYGSSTTCTATVTGSSPTGTVTFTYNSNFWTSCALSSGSCSVSGLSSVALGSYTIAGNYSGDSKNTPASGSTTEAIIQAPQTITFVAPSSPVTYGVQPITLSASGGASGNAVVFSLVSGPGTISGNTLTITGVGTVVVAANQAGNSNYAAATQVTQSVVVNQATQTISFTAPTSPVAYGVSPIALSATGGASGNAVVFSIVSGSGTVSGSTLTITGAGTVVVAANQAGNSNYGAATQVTQSVVVNQASLTVTGNNASRVYGAANPTFAYTITGYVNGDTSSVVSGTATETTTAATSSAPGTYPITFATESLTATNYSFNYVSGTLTISGGAAQTITFPTPSSPVTYGVSPIALSASASSGLAVTFSVASGPGTITSNVLTITGAGTVVVAANQPGNADYGATTQATQSVVVNQAALTVTANNASQAYGAANPTFTYTITGYVNGDTSSVVSGTATATTTATTSSSPGTYPITFATESLAATNYTFSYVSGTLTVSGGATQTITFTEPSSQVTYEVSPVALSASASSGLAVTFGVVSGPGTISGNTLTITGAGTVVVAANQAGNSEYAAAAQVTQSVVVNPGSPSTVYSYCISASPSSSCSSPSGGYDAVGNIMSYYDSVTGTWSMTSSGGASGYDSLNRLTTAQATAGTAYNGLQAAWTYDNFGNRTSESFGGTDTGNAPVPAGPSVTYNANNQIQSVVSGLPPLYDGAGNILCDSYNQSAQQCSGFNQYLYDGEGRICAVQSLLMGGAMTGYLYDAEGTRVAKGTITSWSCNTATNGFAMTYSYILGRGNEQLTELAWSDGVPTPAHTNVWAGGQLATTYSNTDPINAPAGIPYFQLADWLGTRRVLTDQYGNLAETCDSLPFGDGENCPTTPTEHLFTGKERDTESGNDYFGARFYASSMGRFMSPDWSAKQDPVPYAKLDDPQSLNLYAYVRNNPLSRADIDGHSPDWWQKVVNKLSGNGFKTDAQLAPKPGQFTVTLNSRAANIPGGGVLHAAGADHQWITTSDGKAAGMGTAKNGGEVPDKGGQSSPDKPGAPTQVVDEHGDTPTSTHTYTNVDKGAIDSYLTPGTPTGAWVPTVNDCNTWAQNALGQSIPHDAYDRSTDTMVHNAVVYSDGSIHQVNPQ